MTFFLLHSLGTQNESHHWRSNAEHLQKSTNRRAQNCTHAPTRRDYIKRLFKVTFDIWKKKKRSKDSLSHARTKNFLPEQLFSLNHECLTLLTLLSTSALWNLVIQKDGSKRHLFCEVWRKWKQCLVAQHCELKSKSCEWDYLHKQWRGQPQKHWNQENWGSHKWASSVSYFSFCWCCVSSTNTEALCWFFLNSSSLCAELIYTLCDVKMIAAPGILRCTDESSEQVVLTLFFDNLLQCLLPVNFKVTVLQHSEGLSRCVSPGLFLSFN